MNKINYLIIAAAALLLGCSTTNAALVKHELSLSDIEEQNIKNGTTTADIDIDDSKYVDEESKEELQQIAATDAVSTSQVTTDQASSSNGEIIQASAIAEAKNTARQIFLDISDDVPLIEGLKKIEDEDVGFESDSGSIKSSSYLSEISFEEVKTFYLKTLPQLGWDMVYSDSDGISFIRNGNKIEINFSKKPKKRMVKFLISSSL